MRAEEKKGLVSVEVNIDGKSFTLYHDDPKDHIFREALAGRFYELGLLASLRRWIRPGDVVLDVGANVGNHTIFFAGVCRAQVISFEPNPRALSILAHAVEANGLEALVEVRPLACGGGSGRAFLSAPKKRHNLGSTGLAAEGTMPVKVCRIDGAVPRPVRVLKIDTEGSEAEVIEGALQTIANDRPIISVEVSTLESYHGLLSLLRPLNYRVVEVHNFTPTLLILPEELIRTQDDLRAASEIDVVSLISNFERFGPSEHSVLSASETVKQLENQVTCAMALAEFHAKQSLRLGGELERASNELAAIKNSRSWRITSPLRNSKILGRLIRRRGGEAISESLLTPNARETLAYLDSRARRLPQGDAWFPDKNAKRVALVVRDLMERSGGAERIYTELANMLAERGYEVSCLCYDRAKGACFFPLSRRVEFINLAPKERRRRDILAKRLASKKWLPTSVRDVLSWHAHNGQFVMQLRNYFIYSRPDVAISFLPPANTPTLRASRGTKVKIIVTNHNVPKEDYESPDRWDPNPVDRRLRRSSLREASRVHVIFPKFAEWFDEGIREKIVAIPNYVSQDVLEAQPRRHRDKVVLAVGRLSPVKNYSTLAQAWALIAQRFPDWRVVLFGVGPQREELRAEIERLGVAGSFQLRGHSDRLGQEYAGASIFCHPALFEGFGLSVAEALALEVPVVAFSDCAGVNEFVTHGRNGLMVERAGGAQALAAALADLMSDPKLRRRLGSAGPASVEGFTRERYSDEWTNIIESLGEAE